MRASSFFFALFLIFSSNTVVGYPPIQSMPIPIQSIPPKPFPSANTPTTWTNDESSIPSINFTDGSRIRLILTEERFVCGFFCNGNCTSYLFGVFTKLKYPDYLSPPSNTAVIWSANRDHLVSYGAILNLTAAGELVLQDVNGSMVWTTKTSGKSVAGMNITNNGNMVLFDDHNLTVWQSFDHPTDCLVPGQKLLQGQKLIPSVSPTNWTAQKGSFVLQLTNKGLFAYFESNPPQLYYKNLVGIDEECIYAELSNEAFRFCVSSTYDELDCYDGIEIPEGFPIEYIKLMQDGHLKAFGGGAVIDLLTDNDFGECSYPLACGRNAICMGNIQCSCPKSTSPGTDYFRAVDDSQPNKGCSQVTPLTCNATQDKHFIEIKNVKYFTYTGGTAHVDMETCKRACLDNLLSPSHGVVVL